MNSADVLPGKVLFSWVGAPGAWTLALALLGLAGAPLPEGLSAESDEEDDLYQRQVDVRATLQHVSASMHRLADKLKDAQPEDARRLKDAAEKIRVVGLEDDLSGIEGLLKRDLFTKPNFLEAVLRQDEAIRELDEIIALLEKARTEGGAEDERQKSLEALLRQVSEIAGRQENLLKKTRDFLGKEETARQVGELKAALSDIAKKQSALNEGGDPRGADPQAEREDEAALDEALALAQELLDAQKRVEERAAAVSTEKVPLDEVRSLADRLDGLVEQAEDFVGGMEPASSGAEEAPQAKAGAEARPEGRESPGGKSAGKEAGAKSEGKSAEGESPDGKKAVDKAAGEARPREDTGKDASESPGEAREESAGSSKDTPQARESPGAEGKEGPPPRARKDAPVTSPRDAEKSRGQEMIEQARGISEEISALQDDVSRDAPSAKESIAKARSEAARAEAELRANSRDRAVASGKSLLRELKKARTELGRELGGMEEKNAAETAGIVQEQSILEKKASEGATGMESAAQKRSSEAARSSMAEASRAMKEASGSMRQAAESLAGGERPKGREASAKAAQDLSRARDALQKGKEALARRTTAERAADLQKKLARKTEEAGKKVEELQKKIGKKVGEAPQSLAEAESLMKEAAGARQAGDEALARKKGEEALDRIQKASGDLDEEEKLARLRKESPRKDRAEQEDLARLTRDLSKKAREGGSSQGARGQSQDLQQASESMERAGEDLQKEDAESAARDQEEALAKLKKARDQLEEEAEELARLNKERDMTSMVEELTKIKEGQESINSETVKIHASRGPQEGRRERLKRQDVVSRLVLSQGELAEKVDKLSERLQEELSRVFHFVLQSVGADMRQVRDSLKELETGAYTQFLEKEIVDDIDRLLASLKEELSRLSQKESPPMPMEEEDVRRLVPLVAELRMLRGMQVEVNRKTRDLDDVRKASPSGATESWDRALERLMQKQGSVSRMTGDLLEDFRKATGSAAPEGPEPDKR